ncbi:hypothetical protein [Pseudomonas siliginis]|uniref:hypothetical protein n=1 Tax=Pseudomonas siliginis TaxID=2842346 RepID=UPI002093AD77|nr:hypothetical protein [Pseudomonas siliginis]UST77861.1 hypothetical protein NF676_16985 [Pseudomonas siliginis]
MENDVTKKEDSSITQREAAEGRYVRLISTITMHVKYPDLFLPWEAFLTVECFWNPSGTLFTCHAKQYAATNNGRRKGNVYLSFSSSGRWPETELTNDDAIQDGRWHAISGGGSVTGNKHSAEINFKFVFDHELSADKSKDTSVTMSFEVDFRPPIFVHPHVVHSPLPQISGTGYPGALVKLYEVDQLELVIGAAIVDNHGRWTTPLTKPLSMTESFSITALQLYENVPSRWAVHSSFAVLFAPHILGTTVTPERKLSVHGGGGLAGAKLELWLEDKSKGIQLATTVWQDGTWLALSVEAWLPGKHLLTAKQVASVSGQSSDWSDTYVVNVKPPTPRIEVPPASSSVKQALKIMNVWPERASVQIFTDKDEIVVGTFDRFTCTFTPSGQWAVGTTSLRAVQTVDGATSDPSSAVSVKIRPSRPVIEPPAVPIAARQTLSIKFVSPDATLLEMFNEVGESVSGEFTGSGTSRTFTPAQDWSVSSQVKIVQTVGGVRSNPSALVPIVVKLFIAPPSDPAAAKEKLAISFFLASDDDLRMYIQGGGLVEGTFLESGSVRYFTPKEEWKQGKTTVSVHQVVGGVVNWSNLVTLAVQPSELSLANPPGSVSSDLQLTLLSAPPSSSGSVLQMLTEAGAPVTGEFTTGTPRKFKPSPRWPAGYNAVMAVQFVDGVPSAPSNVVRFLVIPAKPEIEPPPKPALPRQRLNIIGVDPGAVTLQMLTEDGAAIEGDFTGVDTSRIFTPAEDWAGTRKIVVVQTVDGGASQPSNVVTVYAPPPKPEIEQPPIPATFSHVLNINRGRSYGPVILRMYTAAGIRLDGEFSAYSTPATFTPRNGWPPGRTEVMTKQDINGVGSEFSDPVLLEILPRKPFIQPPYNPVTSKHQLSISSVYAGDVTLHMFYEDGETVPGYFNGDGEFRTFTPAIDWTGTTKVNVVQIVDDVLSHPSDPVTVSVIGKLPTPVITQPLPHTSHHADLRVQGTCVAGATIAVQDAAGNFLQGNLTYSGTTWYFEYAWLAGPQQIKAQQSIGGETSEATEILEFSIKPATPAIEPPSHPVALKQSLKITGVASGAVSLQMLTEANRPLAGKFTASGANRLFTPVEDWSPGENTVYVMQTVDGVDSDPSDLCTFTVEVEDRPDAPQFQQPQAGGLTSRYPSLKIAGRPGALQTVRFENGATLHEETAGADGILTFTVVEPLDPGTIVLEAKQASGGTDSDWSAPHRFTVKAAPSTPSIEAPRANSETSRYPRIRGTGATGGEIVLRHALDPKEEFAIVDGSTRWNWTAEKAWPLGDYAVQARQTFDGDWSDWTEARSFKVSESRYAIGDATPAIGTPVVGTEQSVLLRIQVISGVSGEVAAGVEVKWRVNGEEELLATTQTDVNGWTSYRYTPETVGKHDILADVTQDNAGVILTELYEVNAVLDDVWAQAAELYLDGERVDAASELVLLRKNLPYKLELKIADDSVLIGSTVTLQNFWGAKERGLTFNPDLGTPLTINKGSSIHWYISTEEANSGFYGLSLASSILPDWELPGRVEAGDLADAVRFDLDGFPQVFGGAPAYPCLGATHTLTLRPQDSSFLLGQDVVLELSAQAADLGVTLSPSIPQTLGEDGLSWLLNCVDSTSAGDFAVWLKVPALEFSSLELPMSLAHNSAEVSERFGPQQMGGSASFWRYGIRAVSTFTGLPAGGVPVTVAVTGKPTMENVTARDGWIFISYYDGESASLTIRNRYGK